MIKTLNQNQPEIKPVHLLGSRIGLGAIILGIVGSPRFKASQKMRPTTMISWS